MGKADRIIRSAVGLGILGLGIGHRSWWGLLGFLPLGVAIIGKCGLYNALGFNTLKKPKEGAA
jgi:hypothetical protein